MLEQAIEEYLLWMIDAGYCPKLWQHYGHILGCFQLFVEKYQIPWKHIFTHTTVKSFEQEYKHKHNAGRFVRMLWKYLYTQGQVSEALVKKTALPDIYEDYLSYYSQKALPDKVQRAQRLLSALHDYLLSNTQSLSSIKITDIDTFLGIYTVSYTPVVRRNERSLLQGFLRYLYYDRKILKRDLASYLVSPPIYSRSKPPKFLRSCELERLFGNFQPESSSQIRAYAMFHLGYSLGLRSKEISLLTLNAIFFSKKEIEIRDRKNTVALRLPLPDATIKAMSAYLIGVRPASKYRRLFLGLIAPYAPVCSAVVSRAISKLVRYANPKASAYWLRHTHAQNLLESGSSIYEVKEMLGHEHINSTEKYLSIHIKLMREVLLDET
jgi:site-specific recombinase XerD